MKRTDKADIGPAGYFSPRDCVHSHLKTVKMHGTPVMIYAYCPVCRLQSEPVMVGLFQWVARQKAVSKFYQLANKVDKE